MKAKSIPFAEDDARFDRLVDGALTSAEYKSLLSSLEDEPGGWRRCALAFLEAQAWSRECGAIRRAETDAVPVARALAEKRSRVASAGYFLAAAASVLLAFGLGLATNNEYFPSSGALPSHYAGRNSLEEVTAPPLVVGQEDPALENEIAAMKLVIDGADSPEVVVPVISDGTMGESLVETEPVIPDSVLRTLRMRGHDIRRQQEFIPVATGDGRHVIFPVEQYRITPVSSRSY